MVAVDVGGYGLRAVQFTPGKNGPAISKIAFTPLPPSAVQGGTVVDSDAVAAALKEMWGRAKFTTKQVVFGVSNQDVIVRQMDLDYDEDGDFRRALRYQVADHIPVSVDETNLDFHTLQEYDTTDAEGQERRMKRILLVAAAKEMVDSFVSAFQKAGLQPVKADLDQFALIRSVNPVPSSSETAEVIVDIGSDNTIIVIHQGGQPQFTRTVSGQSGKFLTETLSRQFSWTSQEAENSKVQLGLTTAPGATPHPAQQVIDHVVSQISGVIRNSVEFYISSAPHVTSLSRVVLTGGGSTIAGFAERLASELKVPVEAGRPLSVVSGKKTTIPEGISEQQLSVAIGLAMGA